MAMARPFQALPIAELLHNLFDHAAAGNTASLEDIAEEFKVKLNSELQRDVEFYLWQYVQYLVHWSPYDPVLEDPFGTVLLAHAAPAHHRGFAMKFYWQVDCAEQGVQLDKTDAERVAARCDALRRAIVDYATFGVDPDRYCHWKIPVASLRATVESYFSDGGATTAASTVESFVGGLPKQVLEFLISYYRQHNSFRKNLSLVHHLCIFSRHALSLPKPTLLQSLRNHIQHMNSFVDEETVIPLFPNCRVLQFRADECVLAPTSSRILSHICVEMVDLSVAPDQSRDLIQNNDLWLLASTVRQPERKAVDAAADGVEDDSDMLLSSVDMDEDSDQDATVQARLPAGYRLSGEGSGAEGPSAGAGDEGDFVIVGKHDSEYSLGFEELHSVRVARIRETSPYGGLPNWTVKFFFAKDLDDLRHDQLVIQIMHLCKTILENAKVDVKLQPYEVIATSTHDGLLETVTSAVPISKLRDRVGIPFPDFFARVFADNARMNFIRSMAGYSLLCYLLNIGDRHEGNMLLNSEGCVVHIDFGWVLANQMFTDVKSPFKLTEEYLEVMANSEGRNFPSTEGFQLFRRLFTDGLMALREDHRRITLMLRRLDKAGMKGLVGAEEEIRRRLMVDVKDQDKLRSMMDAEIEKALSNRHIVNMNDRIKHTTADPRAYIGSLLSSASGALRRGFWRGVDYVQSSVSPSPTPNQQS